MSYRTFIVYERQGKLIHAFFILCAIITGALATIVLSTLGILPDFKVFIPDKLPDNHYLSIVLAQRQLIPLYIHFLSLTVLSYLIFRLLNFVVQRVLMAGIKKEVDEGLKFGEKMRDLRNNVDDEAFARSLYNFRRQLSAVTGHGISRFISYSSRRLAAVFNAVSNLSAENILLINDTIASADYSLIDYSYRLMRLLIRIVIFLGPLASIMGIAVLIVPVVTGDLEINVLASHLTENFTIAGYSVVFGIGLYVLASFSRHLDNWYLTHLDNFLIAEIAQKIPFKSPDSFVLLGTYLRTLRTLEKSMDEKLRKLNDRIDHLIKISG